MGAACTHDRRTHRHVLFVTHIFVLFAEYLFLYIALGILPYPLEEVLANRVKTQPAAVGLDNVIQLFYYIELLHL